MLTQCLALGCVTCGLRIEIYAVEFVLVGSLNYCFVYQIPCAGLMPLRFYGGRGLLYGRPGEV